MISGQLTIISKVTVEETLGSWEPVWKGVDVSLYVFGAFLQKMDLKNQELMLAIFRSARVSVFGREDVPSQTCF